MAETETGWTTERPDANGVYWWQHQQGGLPEPLLLRDGFVYDFADNEPTSIGFYDGRGKWLGPIYASDAEQLSELRQACEVARAWICRTCNQYSFGADDPHDVLVQLNEVLNPKQPGKETQ